MITKIRNQETETRIQLAQALYLEILKLGFNYGCFEVSLAALGAKLTVKDVNRKDRTPTQISKVLRRNGLHVNWLIGSDQKVTAGDISAILENRVQFKEDHPGGAVMGYLWTEHYPKKRGHAIAIVNHAPNSYIVMDTEASGRMQVTSDNLAHMANFVLQKGGRFEIAQVKKK